MVDRSSSDVASLRHHGCCYGSRLDHWTSGLSVWRQMKDEKEKPKLPEGTHVNETDAKNRKAIRQLKVKKNNK